MPTPTHIELKKSARQLCITFDDGMRAALGITTLRENSPAADGALATAPAADLAITRIEPVGNYAIRPHFSDGHQTGIYDWALLYQLARDFGTHSDSP